MRPTDLILQQVRICSSSQEAKSSISRNDPAYCKIQMIRGNNICATPWTPPQCVRARATKISN